MNTGGSVWPTAGTKTELNIALKVFWLKSSKVLMSAHSADLTISVYSYTGAIS